MAEHASDHTHGHMDIRQQQASFHIFMLMSKWGSLAVASVVLAAVLAFCTPAGLGTGVLAGVVLAVLGVAFLREKPGTAAPH
jgi:hypothetical protein